MSHRTAADPERIRRAHADRLDPETADRVMNREFRTIERRDRDAHAWDRHSTADPGEVASLGRHLARGAVVPAALALACAEHDAPAGMYCYRSARGVCAARLERSRHA